MGTFFFYKDGKMVLLIDNYDSFVYNLYQYIGTINPDVKVYRNDEISIDEIKKMNPSHIILSPGPKAPKDAGICIELIKELYREYPILGICLGHQAIGAAFGAKVTYAKELFHGKFSLIEHEAQGIFHGVKSPCQIARYHSLAVEEEGLDEFNVLAKTDDGEIMAMEHKKYPVIGLQFHPESIYTPDGILLIKNFLNIGKMR